MHEIFQFCCNKSQFHFENCHSPFNDFSRNYGCHIGFKLWVTSIFLCFDVMAEQQAKISGRGSEAGPMKSFHDVMCVFSCFSNPPVRFFFSHVKLASNQFDVDNFAFISLLTDSSSSDIIPDLRILNIPLFFLRENCQPYLHTEICTEYVNFHFVSLCYYAKETFSCTAAAISIPSLKFTKNHVWKWYT